MSAIDEARARLSPKLVANLQRADIDIDLTLQILTKWNAGAYSHYRPLQVAALPTIDNRTIIDRRSPQTLELTPDETECARACFSDILGSKSIFEARNGSQSGMRFDTRALHRLGVALYPRVAYGVLNGGSATSYADRKKNSALDPALFGQVQPTFERLAELCRGRPKGLTPALVQPDGTPGPSFLELKMRNLLIEGPALATHAECGGNRQRDRHARRPRHARLALTASFPHVRNEQQRQSNHIGQRLRTVCLVAGPARSDCPQRHRNPACHRRPAAIDSRL